MYRHQEERSVEAVCYEHKHIEKVLEVIKARFPEYFKDFIMLEAGYGVSEQDIQKIAEKLGVQKVKSKKNVDVAKKFKNIIVEAIENFEKDREKYIAIFDQEALEEYEDDPQYFKSTVLKKECPIIHHTLFSSAKELEKYKRDFNISDSNELLTVVSNLCYFAEEYYSNFYDEDTYDQINCYEDLKVSDLDTEDYTVYGVIGGGIKSHMLYKVYPALFPNRSRDAIWALWYLSDKKTFDCKQDSEFLMIDVDKSITQQNYFYPYELFTFYAHQIYQMLKQKADENNVYLDPEYRYIIVDAFLTFVAEQHDEEISFLKQQIRDGGLGYA
ncbi:MAG: hypothetical protein GX306_12470 [Clostridiales bacterium]|jgi:hypothetical protein|uniref:hypothetical protein n=1 Tax=Heyndrickxia coagulans TaxID=1398 RepID=UPI001378B0CB|nr:hypothetical protein [Heyndrickxia coagulans]NCG69317.1 hypothetical protein [Heyndrickxia coagulans]NLK29135.1 hypothetical protein [Clostridiales bacterium]